MDFMFTLKEHENVIQPFLIASSVTYAIVFAFFVFTRKDCARHSDEAMHEFVGKQYEIEYEDDSKVAPELPYATTIVTASHPAVQAELQTLSKLYDFGICKWNNGPFRKITDLTFEKNKLYCLNAGSRTSLSKFIEQTKNTTRPRWINHLCFLQDDQVVLFKDHLASKHGLTFS